MFMVYTDLLALGMILVSFICVRQRRVYLSAAFGLLAFLVRQDAVIWIGFVFVYSLMDAWQARRPALREAWPFLVVFTVVLAFLITNRGIAVHQKRFHPAFEIHFGNLYLFLFLYFVLFLFQNLMNIWRGRSALLRHLWLTCVAAGVFALVYHLTFHVTHPFNAGDFWEGCLRNRILAFGTSSVLGRVLFLLPVLGGFLGLMFQPLQDSRGRLLYLFGFVALVSHWLIEVRYAMPLMTFLIAFRQPQSRAIEIGTTTFFGVLSLALFWAIYSDLYFP